MLSIAAISTWIVSYASNRDRQLALEQSLAAWVPDATPVAKQRLSAFDAPLVPFLLEDVAGRPALNQADGIHPTAEGHARIAERVWRTLGPVLDAGTAR